MKSFINNEWIGKRAIPKNDGGLLNIILDYEIFENPQNIQSTGSDRYTFSVNHNGCTKSK